MEELLKEIQLNYIDSFLHIPNSKSKIFNKNQRNNITIPEDNLGDQEDKDNLIEEFVDSIISSLEEEQNKVQKIHNNLNEKKEVIDLSTIKSAEKLLCDRVDRDIFELKYNNKFIFSQTFDLTNLIQEFLLEDSLLCNELNNIKKCFKEMNMKFEGEIDFIINQVDGKDIIDILENRNKKYFAFGDKTLFENIKYDIYGESTINLFHHNNYIRKFKQLIRYIITIKFMENNKEYLRKKNLNPSKTIIMIVTDIKYNEFIEQLNVTNILGKDFAEKEDMSSKLYSIITNKKYKEEINEYEMQIESKKNKKIKYYEKMKNLKNFKEIEQSNLNYKKNCQKSYSKLKSKIRNILQILKLSGIPFILCYFPKIGSEFPFDLFNNKQIEFKKVIIDAEDFQYKFTISTNKECLSKEELSQKNLTKEELSQNYLTKEELSKNYLTKEELSKNYVTKEELSKII